MNPQRIDSEIQNALQYHKSGLLEKAKQIYEKILKINPNHSDALHLLGLIYYQNSKNDSAATLIEQAVRINSKVLQYHKNLGIIYQAQQKFEKSIVCYQNALKINANQPDIFENIADSYCSIGKFAEAALFYQKNISLKPGYLKAVYNLGCCQLEQNQLEEACVNFHKALILKNDFPEALNNLGNIYQSQDKLSEALIYYQKALAIKPDYFEAHNNLANLYQKQDKIDAAIKSYQNALQIKPDYAEAHYNLGCALFHKFEFENAYIHLSRSLQIKPDYNEVYCYLVLVLLYTCRWEGLEDAVLKLDKYTKNAIYNKTTVHEMPFLNNIRCMEPSLNMEVACAWSKKINIKTSDQFCHSSKKYKQKITIGYLSYDFRDHPVSHLMLGLLEKHNRDEFNIFCYSISKDEQSEHRQKIKEISDNFVDIQGLDNRNAAKHIYDDKVDILIDLMGYTMANRMEILAFRPAPLQIHYLGFNGTLGADFIDYIITDKIAAPEEQAQFYKEKFIYLPDCFIVTDNKQPISEQNYLKSDFGLPEDKFVFCSFCQNYKIEPVMFDIWMKILKDVPESILWLKSGHPVAQENLKRYAVEKGISSERLIFAGNLPEKAKHLARIKLADLAFDTRIINGGSTTIDILWAGVPLITLQGNHFISRMSSSCLSAIGMPELISSNYEDYHALAVHLAQNPSELIALREKLAKNKKITALFDTMRFTLNLEKAYKKIWNIYLYPYT